MNGIAEIALVLVYFVTAVGLVLVAGYALRFAVPGLDRYFSRAGFPTQLERAITIACVGSVALIGAGMVVAFTGYALDRPLMTRVSAIAIAIGLPLIVVAEHWGGNGSRRR